jgi:hypothetical protein
LNSDIDVQPYVIDVVDTASPRTAALVVVRQAGLEVVRKEIDSRHTELTRGNSAKVKSTLRWPARPKGAFLETHSASVANGGSTDAAVEGGTIEVQLWRHSASAAGTDYSRPPDTLHATAIFEYHTSSEFTESFVLVTVISDVRDRLGASPRLYPPDCRRPLRDGGCTLCSVRDCATAPSGNLVDFQGEE